MSLFVSTKHSAVQLQVTGIDPPVQINSLLEWEGGGEKNSLLEMSPTKDFLLTFD